MPMSKIDFNLVQDILKALQETNEQLAKVAAEIKALREQKDDYHVGVRKFL